MTMTARIGRIGTLSLALALALPGCGAEEPEGPLSAELGTGTEEFTAISDGWELRIASGPQGGYHFFGAVRVSGVVPGDPFNLLDPDNPHTVFSVYRDGRRIDLDQANYTHGYALVPGTALFEMTARLVVLDIAEPQELDGVEVLFRVEVTDVDGRFVSDEHMVIGRADQL